MKISLNGYWNYIPDQNEQLTIDKVLKSVDKKSLNRMKLPVNWQLAGLDNFSGAVWFIKKFRLIKTAVRDKPVILNFNGIDYFADVWLNGKYIGTHEGYFQPFYFDISGSILENKNVIVVKVTSPLEEPGEVWPHHKRLIKGIFNHHDCRPGGWDLKHGQDKNTGGIWNDVYLTANENLYIENLKISSKLSSANNAAVLVSVNIYNRYSASQQHKFKLQLTSPDHTVRRYSYIKNIKPGRSNISFVISLKNPQLWWSWDLGKQNLYYLSIKSAELNINNIKFGIREVKLDEKSNFYLNGKKLFLRGTNIIPAQFLSELTRAKIKNIVRKIKEANINIVRVHAHVNRKELYEEFDRQGILVWQDFALQWTYDESEMFVTNAVSQIKDMVTHLYNHPSIAFWCCHNEPGEQIKTLDPFLYDAVLSEDNSRIIRIASNYEEHAYDGWYWGSKEHYAAAPMGPIVTEFGAQALPEISSLKKFIPKNKLFPPKWKYWKYHNFQYDQTFNVAEIEMGNSIEEFVSNSQYYQAELLQTAIDFYRREKNKKITGIFQFMFIDCWPSITWSVVDFYDKPKMGYNTLQKAFQPVYVSVKLRQRKYLAGSKLQIDLWLINDLYQTFNQNKIVVKLNRKKLGELVIKEINTNSNQFIDYEQINIFLPEKIKKGIYKVSVELLTGKNNRLISINDFKIIIEQDRR